MSERRVPLLVTTEQARRLKQLLSLRIRGERGIVVSQVGADVAVGLGRAGSVSRPAGGSVFRWAQVTGYAAGLFGTANAAFACRWLVDVSAQPWELTEDDPFTVYVASYGEMSQSDFGRLALNLDPSIQAPALVKIGTAIGVLADREGRLWWGGANWAERFGCDVEGTPIGTAAARTLRNLGSLAGRLLGLNR